MQALVLLASPTSSEVKICDLTHDTLTFYFDIFKGTINPRNIIPSRYNILKPTPLKSCTIKCILNPEISPPRHLLVKHQTQ